MSFFDVFFRWRCDCTAFALRGVGVSPPSSFCFSFSAFDYIERRSSSSSFLFWFLGKGSFIYSIFIRHMDIWFGMAWHGMYATGNSWTPF